MESPKAKPKSRGKWRLFRCFRADDVVSASRKLKKADPLITYIAVADEKRVVLPTALSSAFKAVKRAATGENGSRQKNTGKDHGNSFRRALMAALSRTSLAKKMSNKKKTNKDCVPSESSNNTSSSSPSSSLGFTLSSLSFSTNSSTTSTVTQASASSIEPYPLRSIRVAKQKQNIGDSRKGHFVSRNIAVSLLLITSLLVLIMCGKCCAIAFTTIGFFVVPNRGRRPCNEWAICEER
ncbi:hypothetical protein CR513_39627, partial [Mucuna pruriens]